jgi:hypothetical protein
MEVFGHIHNGVVVIDSGVTLPEGTRVSVSPVPAESSKPRIVVRPDGLPVVQGGRAGTWNLTNEQIGQILDEEDIEALKGTWNVPS